MTLYSRNKIFSAVSVCFIANVLAILALFFVKFFNHATFFFPYPFEYSTFGSILFKPNTIAALLCIGFLVLFSIITCFFIRYRFETTQSSETLLFMGFLIACMLESYRFLIPLFSLWNSYETLTLIVGKIAFSAKLIALASFLFSALVPTEGKNQPSERGALVIIIVSFVFAEFIPIKTDSILPSIMPSVSFYTMFVVIIVAIFVITTFTMFFSFGKSFALGYFLLILGYLTLTFGHCFFALIVGGVLLIWGTQKYLKDLHEYYMWQ